MTGYPIDPIDLIVMEGIGPLWVRDRHAVSRCVGETVDSKGAAEDLGLQTSPGEPRQLV